MHDEYFKWMDTLQACLDAAGIADVTPSALNDAILEWEDEHGPGADHYDVAILAANLSEAFDLISDQIEAEDAFKAKYKEIVQ